MTGPVAAGTAVAFGYSGTALGSFASGILSQVWGSRKKVVLLFILAMLLGVAMYLTVRGLTPTAFYLLAGYLGFTAGYWAVFVTIAAEQFGTNLRATRGRSGRGRCRPGPPPRRSRRSPEAFGAGKSSP